MPIEIKLWKGSYSKKLKSGDVLSFGCSTACGEEQINDTHLKPIHVTLKIDGDTVKVCEVETTGIGVWIAYKEGRRNADTHIVGGEMVLDHSFELYFYKKTYERQHQFRIEFTNSEDAAGSKRPRSDGLVPVKLERM